MHKILFVCHGSICRSPMAKYVLQDMVDKRGISQEFFIDCEPVMSHATERIFLCCISVLPRCFRSIDSKAIMLISNAPIQAEASANAVALNPITGMNSAITVILSAISNIPEIMGRRGLPNA